MVVCPKCTNELQQGALRCRHCGANARHASPSPVGLGLHHLLRELAPPPIRRALEITNRLDELDPPFMAWMNASSAPRWEDAPKVSDGDHVEIRALFDELMEIAHTYGEKFKP